MTFVMRMLARELRSSWQRLLFFFVCVAIGVGAIVALRSVIQSVRTGLMSEARSIIASDVLISTNRSWTPEVLQPLEERIREHAPALLRPALDAAVVAVADAIEALRVGDRERAQHDRVDQREDRGRAADAERERQNGRGCEDGRETELTDRVTDGAGRVVHTERLDGLDPPSVDRTR